MRTTMKTAILQMALCATLIIAGVFMTGCNDSKADDFASSEINTTTSSITYKETSDQASESTTETETKATSTKATTTKARSSDTTTETKTTASAKTVTTVSHESRDNSYVVVNSSAAATVATADSVATSKTSTVTTTAQSETESTSTGTIVSETSEPFIIYGDADGDGKLTVFDLCFVKRQLLYPERQWVDPEVCDLNGDGKLDIIDVYELQEFLLAIRKQFSRNGGPQVVIPVTSTTTTTVETTVTTTTTTTTEATTSATETSTSTATTQSTDTTTSSLTTETTTVTETTSTETTSASTTTETTERTETTSSETTSTETTSTETTSSDTTAESTTTSTSTSTTATTTESTGTETTTTERACFPDYPGRPEVGLDYDIDTMLEDASDTRTWQKTPIAYYSLYGCTAFDRTMSFFGFHLVSASKYDGLHYENIIGDSYILKPADVQAANAITSWAYLSEGETRTKTFVSRIDGTALLYLSDDVSLRPETHFLIRSTYFLSLEFVQYYAPNGYTLPNGVYVSPEEYPDLYPSYD